MGVDKRLLVISHNAFSYTANNGKTMVSILRNWKKENLAQLFFCSNEKIEPDFCDNYYRVTDFDVWHSLLHCRKNCGGPFGETRVENAVPALERHSWKKDITSWLKKHSGLLYIPRDLLWKCNRWKTKELVEWLEKFKPEAVFFVGGGFGFSHEVTLWICRKYNLPLYLYFTDDYVINRTGNDPLTRWTFWRRRKFYRKSIEYATQCFVIGEYMAKCYSAFFGKVFLPLMNSIEDTAYVPEISHEEIVISFIGGVHLNRWKSLVEFGHLVEQIQVKYRQRIRIDVYCAQNLEPDVRESLSKAPLHFCGSILPEQVLEKARASDFLLHVESNDPKNRVVTQMSVSTKLPEYLITGRCVIAYGPHEVASIRLIQENALGVAITDLDSEDERKRKLLKVFTDIKLRNGIGMEGRKYAKEKYLGEQVRAEFEKVLQSGSQSSK